LAEQYLNNIRSAALDYEEFQGVGGWDTEQISVGADMGEGCHLIGRDLIEDGNLTGEVRRAKVVALNKIARLCRESALILANSSPRPGSPLK
jgi:hypothetical protein